MARWGGTRNGAIVHWPAGITANGEVRSQFTHVIDVAPTVLEAAGIPEPLFVNGVQQAPIEIALAKGKKAYDKRATIAKRDEARSNERATRIR